MSDQPGDDWKEIVEKPAWAGLKVVVDMNLSPTWIPLLAGEQFEAVHWSTIGNPRAKDSEIIEWARNHDSILFTHDLGFGGLLANTQANKPSVFPLRAA